MPELTPGDLDPWGFEGTLERFREAVRAPADEVPLARGALLIAEAEYGPPEWGGVDIEACERRLDDMAETLRQRLGREPGKQTPMFVLHTVNQLLYRELGFHGNVDRYNDPRNLYLNYVLSERTGIPVTLAIVYQEVAQRAGLDVVAVGMPGHVICRFQPPGAESRDDAILVDVFNRGRVLSVRDCHVMLRGIFGNRVAFKPHYLDPMTPRQVLQRVLHNLKAIYLQRGDEERAARVIDLLLVLYPWDLDEIRDRGMLRERLGDYRTALHDLEQYVQFRSGARDIGTVAETVRSLRRHAQADEDD